MTDFIIRPYSKKELALLYFRDSQSGKSAVRRLMRWIRMSPELTRRLQALDYQDSSRNFTPAQVTHIIELLGEP